MSEEPHGSSATPDGVPWTAAEILAALFLLFFFWPALMDVGLLASGFYRWFYGPELVSLREPLTSEQSETLALATGPGAAHVVLPFLRHLVLYRMNLWTSALALPFLAGTVPVLFALLSGTRPERLGLTWHHGRRNLLVGILSVALMGPVVLGLNWGVVTLLQHIFPGSSHEHPLQVLAEQTLRPLEWFLLIFTAVLVAPVREEIVFRGVLQPWFAQQERGGLVALLAALGLALLAQREALETAGTHLSWELLEASLPVLFVLALMPVYWLVCWRSRDRATPALFGTSLLFAAIHSFAWPSPVALFVLGLSLGYLAQRTRSLVAPLVLHAGFNGISCVLIFLQ